MSDFRARPVAESLDHPILSVIDSLLAIETPSMRFLRVNAEAIERMHADMLAERSATLSRSRAVEKGARK